MKTVLLKFCGFCGVGGTMTLLSMAMIAFANELLHWSPQISYIVAYITTLLLSYVLNSKFVFQSSLHIKNAVKYCAAYISGMFWGMLLLKLSIRLFPRCNTTLLNYLIIPMTMVWNFLLINGILRKTTVITKQTKRSSQ